MLTGQQRTQFLKSSQINKLFWHAFVGCLICGVMFIYGAHMVQSEQHMRERRSGHCGSGQRIQVYTADMRCRVALQFYPDDYEWAEKVRSLRVHLHTRMQ